MTADDRSNPNADGVLRAAVDGPLRVVPVAWAALEDAFENNAPEVHSYLHLVTGDVIRVVDGVADPVTHSRIVSDGAYRRVDPVSSREQYRWMERFIATVEDIAVRQRLLQSIDGKGAFRRFKDALMTFPTERERWFVFRSERLKMCMEAWLEAQGLSAAPRPDWPVPGEARLDAAAAASDAGAEHPSSSSTSSAASSPAVHTAQSNVSLHVPPVVTSVRKPPLTQGQARMDRTPEASRAHLVQLASALPASELDTATAFLEFLLGRRASVASAGSVAPAPNVDDVLPRRRSAPEVDSHGQGGTTSYAPANGISVSVAGAVHSNRESESPAPRRVIAAREVDISARRPSSAESDVSRRPVVLESDSARKALVESDGKDADPTRRSSGRV